jgi:hypothetical protein
MVGRTLFIVFLVVLFSGTVIATYGATYARPAADVRLTDGSRAFLAYDADTGMERYAIRPVFAGNASDIGLVIPTPSRPVVESSGEHLFQDLGTITTPQQQDTLLPIATDAGPGDGVTVIDREPVRDYDATVFTAKPSTALLQWLQTHGYDISVSDRDNLQYYTEKNGYYFTALRINGSQFTCDDGRCGGSLAPVELRFRTDRPYAPLRIHRENHTGPQDGRLRLYTLSDQPLIVAGATVEYANVVDDDKLANHSAAGRFLVAQEFGIDRATIEDDLWLQKSELFHVGAGERTVVNPFDGVRNGVASASGQGYIRKHGGTMAVTTGADPGLIDRTLFVLEAVIPLF